jgi:hypothetical protein
MPSTDTKPELTAKASMAQPVSQTAVYASGLRFTDGTSLLITKLNNHVPYKVWYKISMVSEYIQL